MSVRTAASVRSTRRTGPGSPAVNRLARYSAGMRSASMAAKTWSGSASSYPAACTMSATGDSGGMYQTIGSVRYSGCSGSATRCRAISA